VNAATRRIVGWPGRRMLLKLLERGYRVQYPRRSRRQAQARARMERCPHRKPADRIAREIGLLQRHWGCYPFHYLRYDLFRADRDLPDTDLLAYIPEFFLYHVYLPLFEGDGDPTLFGDKLHTVDLFDARGIAQPEVLGRAEGGRWRDAAGDPCAAGDLLAAWSRSGRDRVFLKPALGSGGQGIRVLRPHPAGWAERDAEPITPSDLESLAARGRWLAQAGVDQVAETARYYGGSVNTYRINTAWIAGEVSIPCAVIRIGGGGRELDNAALGGVMVGVEAATGRTTPTAGNELMETFPTHPDSGHVFAAETLTSWPAVRDFALAAARELPEFGHLAWDIAATQDGPVALEANIGFGIDCYQSVLGGLAPAFGIDAPDRFWR
jgi:hypothetical protein